MQLRSGVKGSVASGRNAQQAKPAVSRVGSARRGAASTTPVATVPGVQAQRPAPASRTRAVIVRADQRGAGEDGMRVGSRGRYAEFCLRDRVGGA